jgi:hypothetical protein
MTSYQDKVARSIRRETAAKLAGCRAEYGPRFRDFVAVNPDAHGAGRPGFTTEFDGRRSSGPMTLVGFARWVYGTGTLRRVDDHVMDDGRRYPMFAVLSAE